MKKSMVLLFFFILFNYCYTKEIESFLLEGIPISSDDPNSTWADYAFDGNFTSEYESLSESNGWVGLEFPEEYHITKIGWSQNSDDKSNYLLSVFEGANDPSFMDAIPLTMITEEVKNLKSGKMNYITIDCTKKFKYFRYIGPSKKYCIIAEIEVYGYSDKEENEETENEKEEKVYQTTGIPLVVIHTETLEGPKTDKKEVNCNILIINENKITTNASGTIKLRGNSTLRTEKKSFNIQFSSKQKILSMKSKAKKWTMLANHMDKTLIRNLVAFKVGEIFEADFSPECESVDVIVNGEFEGNYIFCDKIEVGKGRVEIEEMDETCNEEPEITGGYLLEIGGVGWGGRRGGNNEGKTQLNIGRTNKGISYEINYPKENDITEKQSEYIKNKMNEYEEEVYSGIIENLDLESFCKHFLVEEYCANVDFLHGNYFLEKKREDEKIYYGPVWDFDLGLDNHWFLYPTNPKEKFTYKFSNPTGTIRDYLLKLLENEEVLDAIRNKWEEINDIKNVTEEVMDFIEEQLEMIEDSQKLNFVRWDILNKKIAFENEGRGSFEAEVQVLKDFIGNRTETLTRIIDKANVTNVSQDIEKRH